MGMSPDAVRSALFERCGKFRRELALAKKPGEPEKPVADEMLDILTNIARTSNNEFVVMSAAKFVRDDLKGRRDAVPTDAGTNEQIMQFLQAQMARVTAARQKFFQREPLTIEANGGS
jgi:hypothetical protein